MSYKLTAEEMEKLDGFDSRPASDPQNHIKAPQYLQDLIAKRKAEGEVRSLEPARAVGDNGFKFTFPLTWRDDKRLNAALSILQRRSMLPKEERTKAVDKLVEDLLDIAGARKKKGSFRRPDVLSRLGNRWIEDREKYSADKKKMIDDLHIKDSGSSPKK